MKDIYFEGLLLLEIQANWKKIGFGKENQLSPQCVLTLGPMAQATLVLH